MYTNMKPIFVGLSAGKMEMVHQWQHISILIVVLNIVSGNQASASLVSFKKELTSIQCKSVDTPLYKALRIRKILV